MFETWIRTDLSKLPSVVRNGVVFSQDSGINRIGVSVFKNGEPVTLSGDVRAWIIKPDGTTITAEGEKNGNAAWVVLPNEAYSSEGHIGIYLKLVNGSEVATIGCVEGYVKTST